MVTDLPDYISAIPRSVELIRVLRETIAYCASRLPPVDPMSSGLLFDLPLRSKALANEIPNDGYDVKLHQNTAVIERVCDERRKLTHALFSSRLNEPIVYSGRLLSYSVGNSLVMGTSEQETTYLDSFDTPAWDCWLMLHQTTEGKRTNDTLISWVPDVFVDGVSRAMHTDAACCFDWLNPALMIHS